MKRWGLLIFKIIFSIPTIMVCLEILIFGWSPKVGFFSQFYNPRVQCTARLASEKIEGANYTYEIDIKLSKPIIEFIPFAPKKVHNINFYTYPDAYINNITAPEEVAVASLRYSLSEKEGLKRGFDFGYRFIDVDELRFHVKGATTINLGKKECALNVSFY